MSPSDIPPAVATSAKPLLRGWLHLVCFFLAIPAGVLIIALLDNGLNLMGVNQYAQMVIKGAVVILAVLIGQDRGKTSVMK